MDYTFKPALVWVLVRMISGSCRESDARKLWIRGTGTSDVFNSAEEDAVEMPWDPSSNPSTDLFL